MSKKELTNIQTQFFLKEIEKKEVELLNKLETKQNKVLIKLMTEEQNKNIKQIIDTKGKNVFKTIKNIVDNYNKYFKLNSVNITKLKDLKIICNYDVPNVINIPNPKVSVGYNNNEDLEKYKSNKELKKIITKDTLKNKINDMKRRLILKENIDLYNNLLDLDKLI